MKWNIVIKTLFLTVAIIILFFGLGLLNTSGFQEKAKQEAKKKLTEHFLKQGERITEFTKPDYSLGMIEVYAVTNTGKYYAVLGVKSPWWVESSILNLVVRPSIDIVSIDSEEGDALKPQCEKSVIKGVIKGDVRKNENNSWKY